MEMGIKKWMELDSPQIEPIWVSQLTELAPLSQQQRHPGLKFLKTNFSIPETCSTLFLKLTDGTPLPFLPISNCGHFLFALVDFLVSH